MTAQDSCDGGGYVDISDELGDWYSNDNSVAKVTLRNTEGMAPGTTTGWACGAILEGSGTNCAWFPVCASAPVTVVPSISQNTNLWYFGGGIPVPSGFTLGSTSANLTANGAITGTFTWTITSGTSKLQLENGSTTITKTNANTVGVSSISYSTQADDVTVQLQYTPSGGSAISVSYSLTIDSPYKLLAGSVTNSGAKGITCNNPPTGTSGFDSKVNYTIVSFLGVQISNIGVNETFATAVDDYIGNNWPVSVAGGTTTTTGAFYDNICVIFPTGTPPSLAPQSPLSGVKIDHTSQFWFVGSTTSAAGVEVQSDTLQRYQDHGIHSSIVSPVR